MSHPILELLLRWMHVLAACLLVGGILFQRFALFSSYESNEEKLAIASRYRSPWSKMVMLSSGLLLLSGVVNGVRIVLGYEFANDTYALLLALKMMLALGVFWISAMLAGRSTSAKEMQQKLTLWMNINVVLAMLVVCIGGAMKLIDRVPKTEDSSTDRATVQRIEAKGPTYGQESQEAR